MILIASSIVIADEMVIGIDQAALLTPNQDDLETVNSRIAVQFTIPDSLADKHIVYGELVLNLDFSGITYNAGTAMELQAQNITSGWTEGDADWDNLAEDIDSLSFYTYTFTMSSDANVFMDITTFIQSLVNTDGSNYGLMLVPLLSDQQVFHPDEDLIAQIKGNGSIKITYDEL